MKQSEDPFERVAPSFVWQIVRVELSREIEVCHLGVPAIDFIRFDFNVAIPFGDEHLKYWT